MNNLTIREIFPKRLGYYMREYNKTRKDIERDLGFKYSTIRDWEKGITVPRMDKVEMLANYFHCTNSDLLEEKEKPSEMEGLSDSVIELMELVKTLSDEDAALLLVALKANQKQ